MYAPKMTFLRGVTLGTFGLVPLSCGSAILGGRFGKEILADPVTRHAATRGLAPGKCCHRRVAPTFAAAWLIGSLLTLLLPGGLVSLKGTVTRGGLAPRDYGTHSSDGSTRASTVPSRHERGERMENRESPDTVGNGLVGDPDRAVLDR